MIREARGKCSTMGAAVLCLCVCFLYSPRMLGGEDAPAPNMPSHWKVTSDALVQAKQVKALSEKLGADLRSVRNVVYDVGGKRVQINVLVTPDAANADKLMKKLKSMKSEDSLLRKDLIVYEFVGQNDVLPIIAEGRKHLTAT